MEGKKKDWQGGEEWKQAAVCMKAFFPPLFFNRALDWHSVLPNRALRQSRSRQKRRFKSQNVDPSCRARHRKEETRTSCSPHIVWVCQNGIFRINVNFFFLFLRPTKRRQNAFSIYVMGQFLWQNNLTRGSVPHFKVEITSDCLVQLGGGRYQVTSWYPSYTYQVPSQGNSGLFESHSSTVLVL